jgi:hypothetical protein
MATREELLAEAYRRGLMPPQQRAAYEEAQRRGIVKAEPAKAPASGFVDAYWKAAGRSIPAMLPGPFGTLGKIAQAAFPQQTQGFVQRAVQAPTFGLSDELVSAVPAVAAATRGQSPRQAFNAAQQQQRNSRDQFARTNPKTALAADVTGIGLSAAIPVGGAAKALPQAASLGNAMLRGAAIGGAQGALSGFGMTDGGLGERGEAALGSGLLGAGLGAAVPMVATVGQGAFRNLPQPVQNATMAAMGRPAPPPAAAGPVLATPEQIALRHLTRNLETSGLTLDDLRAAPTSLTAAEAMGRTGQRQLGALARMEGQTADDLGGLITARREGRPLTLSDEFARATGVDPDAAAGNIDALVDAGRRKAAPLYEQAYADAIDLTPTLQGLTQRPAVQKAMRNARTMMQNDGLDPDALGLTVSPNSGDIPIMEVSRRPSMQLWDYVKRGLDDEIDAIRDPVTRTFKRPQEARQLSQMAADLRNELTSQSPAYRQALDASGDYLKADSAFKSAPKLVFDNKLSPRAFAQQVAKMTEGEREALKAGIANHALTLVNSGRMAPKTLATPGVRQKLVTVLGEDGAGNLIKSAELEVQKAAFESRYGPAAGSVTSDMLAGGEELAQSVGGGPLNLGRMVTNPIQTLKAGGEELINRAYSAATQPGQVAARDAIGQRYLSSPQELADWLEANKANIRPPVFPRGNPLNAPNPFAFTPAGGVSATPRR